MIEQKTGKTDPELYPAPVGIKHGVIVVATVAFGGIVLSIAMVLAVLDALVHRVRRRPGPYRRSHARWVEMSRRNRA